MARGIAEKLVRRHPHVFGDVQVSGPDEVRRNWDAIKAAERAAAGDGGPGSVLDGVPMGQPALSLAAQLQRRAAAAGVAPEASHLPEDSVSELGAELFALVAKAQAAGLNPELELRHAAGVFRDHVPLGTGKNK